MRKSRLGLLIASAFWAATSLALFTLALVDPLFKIAFTSLGSNVSQTSPIPRLWLAAVSACALCLMARTLREEIILDRDGNLPMPPRFVELTDEYREITIHRIANAYEFLGGFPDILSRPYRYIERITEEAETQRNSLLLTVQLDVNFPTIAPPNPADPEKKGREFVPILWSRKGTIPYNLQVQDGQGKSLPILPPRDVKAITALVAEYLFLYAYLRGEEPTTDDELTALKVVLDCVWSFAPFKQDRIEPALRSMEQEARARGRLESGLHDDLRRLCDMSIDNYLWVVEAKVSSRVIIKYSRNIPMYRLTKGRVDRFRTLLKILFAARPDQVVVPISSPYWVPNYHFRVNAEPGQYVTENTLYSEGHEELDLNRTQILENATDEPSAQVQAVGNAEGEAIGQEGRTPRFVIRSAPDGLPHSNIYLARFHRSTTWPKMYTIVKFEEVPPGVLGGATLVAFGIAALASLFTLMHPQARGETATGMDGGNIPALLVAFTAVGVSWLGLAVGLGGDRESLQRASLTARIGLVAAALLALASAMVYVYFQVNDLKRPPRWNISFAGGKLNHDYLSIWVVLSTLAFLLFATLFVALCRRMCRYRRDEQRAQDPDSS